MNSDASTKELSMHCVGEFEKKIRKLASGHGENEEEIQTLKKLAKHLISGALDFRRHLKILSNMENEAIGGLTRERDALQEEVTQLKREVAAENQKMIGTEVGIF